jgi:hypothetical protein
LLLNICFSPRWHLGNGIHHKVSFSFFDFRTLKQL